MTKEQAAATRAVYQRLLQADSQTLRRLALANIPAYVTARGDAMDRVVGLEMGADDYLPKPFEPRELLARIQTILRRAAPAANANGARQLRFEGGLVVDLDRRTVQRGDLVFADGSGIAPTGGAMLVAKGADGERRFAVFEVNESRKDDHAFFRALNRQLDEINRELDSN